MDVAKAAAPIEAVWLPSRWTYLPITMIFVAGLLMGRGGGTPPSIVLICLVAAVLATLARSGLRRIEQRAQGLRRAVTAIAGVAVPLLLYSFGVLGWRALGDLPNDLVVAGLILVGGAAGVYSSRHPVMLCASQAAVWLPWVVSEPSVAGSAALGIGFIIAAVVSREQLGLDRSDDGILEARARAQSRARDILADYEETGQGWFWETDRRSQLTYISPPVAKLLGFEPEELLDRPLKLLFDLQQGQDGERSLSFHLSARSAFHELAVRAAVADERWWSVSGRPIYDNFDNFVGFRGSGTDLTEKRKSQEQVRRLATCDSLTGLANRLQVVQSLEKILSSQQEMNRCCAVFLLDLDRFKQVNDTLGHPAGDALLGQVAQRIDRTVGKMGQVGRLGGDEFMVIIPNRIERRRLAELADQIIHTLSHPYSINGHTAIIGASVGIALAPDDGTTNDDLIRNADLALYAAKDGGRGRHHFYTRELHAEAEVKAQLEKDLRNAIHQGELELHYQPVVATATEQIAGFEALLRWNHPRMGWIQPERFIAIAEDSGLISQIGEWALRTACKDLATWPEEVRCAVNVSPLQFANVNLPAIVANAIAHAGVAPSRLELEITESVFLNDDEGTEAMFASLKGLGVRLALDDFGTGYSSLGYLKNAPFNKIKIDKSFVSGATQPGSRNGAIIASITSLANALGMDTTAEGVETLDELDLVRLHGCSHVQGYIYEKPLTAAAASERLRTGLSVVAEGPRSARASRQTTLRKILLDHQGQIYNGTVRNISSTGALIEGLWNVPVGTIFRIELGEDSSVTGTTRWSKDGRIGVEFATAIKRNGKGQIEVAAQRPSASRPIALRKAG